MQPTERQKGTGHRYQNGAEKRRQKRTRCGRGMGAPGRKQRRQSKRKKEGAVQGRRGGLPRQWAHSRRNGNTVSAKNTRRKPSGRWEGQKEARREQEPRARRGQRPDLAIIPQTKPTCQQRVKRSRGCPKDGGRSPCGSKAAALTDQGT